MSFFKRVQIVCFAVAALCVVLCFAVRFPVFGQDAESTQAKLTALQTERRDVLNGRVEAFENLFKSSRGSYEAVIDARDDLLDAEYELADSKARRIELLQQKLANAKQYEMLMKQRKSDGRGSEADVLTATARRLGVEIELLREQE